MPSFPTDTFTATDLDVFIPEVWGEKINEFLKTKLVLNGFFMDRSDELSEGGDTLHTPNISEMTANAKANATAVTLNSPTETKVDLVVDQWYEVSFMIEDRQAAQVKKSYALQERYGKNAAYTVARKLEVALATLFSGFSNSVGSSTTNIADSDVRKAIGIYEGNNNDPEDGAFFFDSKVFWNQLQNIDKFSLAINSPVQDPVAKRPTTRLYGYPVWLSNNIQYVSGTTGRYNALASSDAIHFATGALPVKTQASNQMIGTAGVRVQTHYIPDYLGFLTTADLLYGSIENRDDAGVRFLSPAS